jgi:bisphosphoglycerate-independent phosphoglycerate mutase (AlkP superfamily)
MEVQGDRRHSENLVPTVVIGEKRHEFAEGFTSLMDIMPGILRVLGVNQEET